MRKHFPYCIFVLLLTIGTVLSAAELKTAPPNIILVLVDDLGAIDLSYTGSSFHQTPHIDSLSQRGMVFTNGYAACAVCSPTRAALQSGKTPAQLGLTDWIRARFQGGKQPELINGQWPYEAAKKNQLSCPVNPIEMELDQLTIAERLKAAGYRTGYIGKWHLGSDAFFPDKQGYDVNIGGCDLGQPPSYFDPYYPDSREHKIGNPKNHPAYRITTLSPEKPGDFLTDREAREAVKFMTQSKDKPFYLQVSHYAVHTPIMCREQVNQKYLDKRAQAAKENPDLLKPFDGDRDDMDPNQKTNQQRNAVYAGLIESVDDAMGTILKAVDDLNIADNTIVIFTSDNGGFCGVTDNFPLREGKGTPYEGGLRVPLIIYIPEKLKTDSTPISTDIPFYTCDFLPTLLDFAGVPLSEQQIQSQKLDGRNFAPYLRGDSSSTSAEKHNIHSDLFWHFPHYRRGFDPYSVARSGDWKLIRFYTLNGYRNELYNLKSDPRELNDCAEQNAPLVKLLSDKLDSWLTNSGARLPQSP